MRVKLRVGIRARARDRVRIGKVREPPQFGLSIYHCLSNGSGVPFPTFRSGSGAPPPSW